MDPAAAIDWVRIDAPGLGRRFAIAATEVCDLIITRDDEVTIRWVPAYHEIAGNEKTGKFAKAAAGQTAPRSDDVPSELRWEANLPHTTRSATETRLRATAE